MTIRHRFDFADERDLVGDDLVRSEAWDALRTRSKGVFAIARDRAELERQTDVRAELGQRARAIDQWLTANSVDSVASYGVGAAVLETWLLRLAPERRLLVTDYAPETAARLRELLPEAQVHRHDLLVDGPLEADVHLFHRIDTEFTNAEWRQVLRRFANETLLVVATEVADFRRLVAEVARRLTTRRLTKAGWLRTRAAFEALWRPTHEAERLELHDLQGWVLRPREPGT